MSGFEFLIPVSFFVMGGLIFLARSEIGRAVAHAIRANAGHGHGDLDELRAEVAEVRQALEGVRQELAETHERLDFTERLLAQARTPEQLPKG